MSYEHHGHIGRYAAYEASAEVFQRAHSSFVGLLMSYNLNNRSIASHESGQIFRETGYFAAKEYFSNSDSSLGGLLRNTVRLLRSERNGKPPHPITGDMVLIECEAVDRLPTSVDIQRHADSSVTVENFPQVRVRLGDRNVVKTSEGSYEMQSYAYTSPDSVLAEMVVAANGSILEVRRSEDGIMNQYLVGFGVINQESFQQLSQKWPVNNGLYSPPEER